MLATDQRYILRLQEWQGGRDDARPPRGRAQRDGQPAGAGPPGAPRLGGPPHIRLLLRRPQRLRRRGVRALPESSPLLIGFHTAWGTHLHMLRQRLAQLACLAASGARVSRARKVQVDLLA